MSSTSSSISSSSSISGRTVQNNDINEFHPEFVTDRFSFFNHDNPYVRIRSNRHSIGTPSHTEVLRECKRFNSPHLLNILTKSPLSPILDNSLLSRLKGNRSSQDTLITPSKKLYDNTGNVDFKSLMTINNDLQLSFHEDVIKCEVDYINLDHSNYESLQSEMLQVRLERETNFLRQFSNIIIFYRRTTLQDTREYARTTRIRLKRWRKKMTT